MRKGGFNMYMTKERKNVSIYKEFKPQTVKHKDAEVGVYVCNVVSRDVSRNMRALVRSISAMVASGLSLKE